MMPGFWSIYKVGKISLKGKTVDFEKVKGDTDAKGKADNYRKQMQMWVFQKRTRVYR